MRVFSGVAILDELPPVLTELRQDGEPFGAGGGGKVAIEGDEGKGAWVVAASYESGRQLECVHAAQAAIDHKTPCPVHDRLRFVNGYPC
jgi:hypothetical protein